MYTAEYAEQQRIMHADKEQPYGVVGHNYATTIRDLWARTGQGSVLDYGAGKGTLAQAIPVVPIVNYDPFIPEWSHRPEGKFDLVVCTDVMEHVEPAYTLSVLDDIRQFSANLCFFQIALKVAKKTLPDGRNAHINLQTAGTWLDLINARWNVRTCELNDHGVIIVG